jgi:flagellar M-ring protein FliF
MATFTEYRDQIKRLLDKFSLIQKITLAVLAFALILAFVLIISWASRPQMAVLFSGLNPKDAGKIVDELKTSKIPYKVEAGGSTILVSENQVYEQRMKFANLGIPQEGIVGYEIFDQTKLGMTDFVQKLNYHRALEGELARTLTGLEEIAQARVHIVIPKPALFEEDKKPTTASVVLRMKPSAHLKREQVGGITNLIASSVEGLATENITIIDSRGNVLSSEMGKDRAIALSASQYEMTRHVEGYLEEKAQSMLIGALGPDRSIIRVTAELNFDRIEKTSQTFDPEGQVVRSEEVTSKTGSSGSQNPQPNTTLVSSSNSSDNEEGTVTNYEISNTVEHVVEAAGSIERLSIAVLVDGNYRTITDATGKKTREYVERTQEELGKLDAIVKNAIGFNKARGDQITVSSMPFDSSREMEVAEEFARAERYRFWQNIIQKGIMALMAIAILLTANILLRRSRKNGESLGGAD